MNDHTYILGVFVYFSKRIVSQRDSISLFEPCDIASQVTKTIQLIVCPVKVRLASGEHIRWSDRVRLQLPRSQIEQG